MARKRKIKEEPFDFDKILFDQEGIISYRILTKGENSLIEESTEGLFKKIDDAVKEDKRSIETWYLSLPNRTLLRNLGFYVKELRENFYIIYWE